MDEDGQEEVQILLWAEIFSAVLHAVGSVGKCVLSCHGTHWQGQGREDMYFVQQLFQWIRCLIPLVLNSDVGVGIISWPKSPQVNPEPKTF